MRVFSYIKAFVVDCLKDEAGWVVLLILFSIVATTAGFILVSR